MISDCLTSQLVTQVQELGVSDDEQGETGLHWNTGIEIVFQVHYERVNLADIDTSSDEDDYGDLFAAERGRIVKGRPKVSARKKGEYK